MVRKILHTVITLSIATAMAVSGYKHLDNQFYFLATIYSYEIVGESMGQFLALGIPALQLTITIALLFDSHARRVAFLFAMLLFVLFTAAQVSAWVRELNISCGCFGSADTSPIGPLSISLAAGGFVLSLLGAFLSRPPQPSV